MIINLKRSAPPPRVVTYTTNDADVSSPLSTATGMSPGIPPMNGIALLRNLSKLNVYDVTGQHSDDEEYDDEGNPLATVVEDAIDDDDDGGGKCPPALPPPALPKFNINRLRELSKFNPDDCMDSGAGGDDNDDVDDTLDDDDDNGGGNLPEIRSVSGQGRGSTIKTMRTTHYSMIFSSRTIRRSIFCPFQTSRITNAGAIASWAAPSSNQTQLLTRRDDTPPNESNSLTKLDANFINK